ncbi:hypothetical protein Pan241w_52700 [Gimesia alba]|uniref:Uncharacterized protein n=1 Tax=Gimesia alba TaxID=2527973 RepID=A0A517RMP2_9PLAN|nr:hypothetical protein [Gimesia alba]QDT45151.1 hypothetical protein Pan241w_52700 [Gimesia alba]
MGLSIRGSEIIADQAVHGYSNGHRLLAASKSFGKQVERQMRMLSDLSGPTISEGFEKYWTAYPLIQNKYFAIAKTWIATEFSRPGCVWTHTLIFRYTDLLKLNSIEDLLDAFIHPESMGLERYEEPVSIRSSHNNIRSQHLSSISFQIAEDFYKTEDPVCVRVKNSELFERDVFELWLFHARLTAKLFSFCTGAIRLRQIENQYLDVQLSTSEGIRDAIRSHSQVKICDISTSLTTDKKEKKEEEGFAFVSKYLSSDSRAEIGQLYSVAKNIADAESGGIPISNVAEKIASNWPSSKEAQGIKTSVFGSSEVREYFLKNDELVIVESIISPKVSHAFDLKELKVANTLKGASVTRSQEVCRLLSRGITKNKKDFVSVALDTIVLLRERVSTDILEKLSENEICQLIKLRPDYLICKKVWELADRQKLNKILETANIEATWVNSLIETTIEISEFEAISHIISTNPELGIRAILDKGNQDTRLASRIMSMLSSRSDLVCEWLDKEKSISVEFLGSLFLNLDPASEAFLHCSSSSLENISNFDRNNSSDLNQFLDAFLFSIALTHSEKELSCMVSRQFPSLYSSVCRSSLARQAWSLLDRFLPRGFFWSPAKRFRIGLVSVFINNEWPVNDFLRAIPDEQFVTDVCGMWGWDEKEMEFLTNVVSYALESGQDIISRKIYKRFRKYSKYFI